MRKNLFILGLVMMVMPLAAQTAINNVSLQLEEDEVLELKRLPKGFYSLEEENLSVEAKDMIEASSFFKTTLGNKSSHLMRDIKISINELKSGADLQLYLVTDPYDSELSVNHTLAGNATFRRLVGRAIQNFLVGSCKLYPACYQKELLKRLDDVLALTTEMKKHTYSHEMHVYESGYQEDVLVKDGRKFAFDVMDYEDYKMVYTIEGWIARRMVCDKVPLGEIRNYVQNFRDAVAAVDMSGKPEYVGIYTANNTLKLLVTTGKVICQFPNGKQVDNACKVVYTKENGRECYKLYTEYDWSDDSWGILYTVYDAQGNEVRSGKELEE